MFFSWPEVLIIVSETRDQSIYMVNLTIKRINVLGANKPQDRNQFSWLAIELSLMITSCFIMSIGLSLVAGLNRNIQALNLSRRGWISVVLLSQYAQYWGTILGSLNHFERKACPSRHRFSLFLACLFQAVIKFLIFCFYHWNK